MKDLLEKLNIDNLAGGLPDVVINGAVAIAILLGGYLLAKLIASIVTKAMQKAQFLEKGMNKIGVHYKTSTVSHILGKIVFFIILLFVIVAFFDTLGLQQVNGPINSFISTALPGAINALGLAVAAWVIASLSRFALSKTLQKMHLDKKISHDVKTSANVSDTIANIAYWFIILFFLPGILGALGQQELLSPIMGIRDQILNFIPNIIAAGVVFIIGWFIAKVLKKITLGVLESIHLDKNLEKTGLKGFSFTQLAGTVVYAIVIIPVAIEALDQLHIDSISGPATVMLSTVLSYIPALFSAIIIVAVAYFIGKFIAKLTSDLLAGMGFDKILGVIGLNNIASKTKPSAFVGNLLLLYILLLAIIEAASKLGFNNLSVIIENFLVFGTNVLVGIIIFGIGMYLANLASIAIKTTSKSKLLPKIAKAAILIFTAAMGLKQMGMADDIINMTFGLTLGSLAVAAALAIGLGAREVAGQEVKELIEKLKK